MLHSMATKEGLNSSLNEGLTQLRLITMEKHHFIGLHSKATEKWQYSSLNEVPTWIRLTRMEKHQDNTKQTGAPWRPRRTPTTTTPTSSTPTTTTTTTTMWTRTNKRTLRRC